jgi:hypothetical protein
MRNAENTTDEYDSPWKDILDHAFPEFMGFYFPDAHAQIDWADGHEFKHTELRQVVRDAELGKRFADALVQVTLRSGERRLIYIHIEIQGQRDADFAQRMFTYNYRLFDRYACPIASLAVLADDNDGWKPDHYGFDLLGCRHSLIFPIVKLLEFTDQVDQLEADRNPFALVTAAHLRTRQTKGDPDARYQAKRALVHLLYRHDWSRRRILDLFVVLDWMMRLPEALELQLWQDIELIEGEMKMPYVTSIERLASERGLQQGKMEGRLEGKLEGEAAVLERLLTKRFGPLDEASQGRLKSASLKQLEQWTDRILDAPTLWAVFEDH